MFFRLWNFLNGYVIIKIKGFSTERFINLAILKGIYLWEIKKDNNETIIKVSVKDFMHLRECGKRTNCKIEILSKKGVPFTIEKYKKRKLYVCGLIFFILSLYISSSFVWSINVTGNERVSSQEILNFCSEQGLFKGQFKPNLENKNLAQMLILSFKDISWVSISTTGTEVTISVVETLPNVEIENKITAMDIVSDKECIIESISVSLGTPMVKEGDVVGVGDVLISGQLNLLAGEEQVGTEYTYSKGEIIGKIVLKSDFIADLEYVHKFKTGETKKDTSLTFNNYKINILSHNLDENWAQFQKKERKFTIGNTILPFSIVTEEFLEYNEEIQTRTEEEAKLILDNLIENYRQELSFNNIEILNENIEFEKNQNSIMAKTTFTVLEEIGIEKETEIKENNTTENLEDNNE